MNTKMKISCIIIGYNTCNELELLLESINNQDYHQKDIEVIYVDDGSDDNSYALFTDYDLKYLKQSIKLEKNLLCPQKLSKITENIPNSPIFAKITENQK